MSDNWKEPEDRQLDASSADQQGQNANTAGADEKDTNVKAPLNNDLQEQKAWGLLENVVQDLVVEKRRARRWGIFFKLLIFVYLFAGIGLMVWQAPDSGFSEDGRDGHTAVIDLKGPIMADQPASADNLIASLKSAYKDEKTKGIVFRINSPGGSPVQSGYVFDEIKRQKALHPEIPVYAVITDIGASGAYYIAAAADEIYADKASLVGSIGVISAGFGFVDALDKVGVSRRVYAAGEHKAFLDPFQPQEPSQTEFWREVLATTHQQFIDSVKAGRGDRLKEDPDLFSGLVWSGEQALAFGLIDGLGSASSVARERIEYATLKDFTKKPNKLEQLLGRMGASAGQAAVQALGLTPELR